MYNLFFKFRDLFSRSITIRLSSYYLEGIRNNHLKAALRQKVFLDVKYTVSFSSVLRMPRWTVGKNFITKINQSILAFIARDLVSAISCRRILEIRPGDYCQCLNRKKCLHKCSKQQVSNR